MLLYIINSKIKRLIELLRPTNPSVNVTLEKTGSPTSQVILFILVPV